MKTFLLLLAVFWGSRVFAEYQDKPSDCVKKEVLPCAVWVLGKTHFPRAGMQVYVSENSLFEFRNSEIYLIRGKMWIVSDRPVRLTSRFGAVEAETKNEIWAEATDEGVLARALRRELQVTPRGAVDGIALESGFELRLSYVNPKTGVAEYSWPSLVNLSTHLKSFQTLVPSDTVFKQKAGAFASVLLKAVKVAALIDQQAFERKLASEDQLTSQRKRIQLQPDGRDSFLRELFRKKSDFEE
jgi:hypothetical protein